MDVCSCLYGWCRNCIIVAGNITRFFLYLCLLQNTALYNVMMNVNNIVNRRSEAMFLLIAAAVAVSLVSILAYLRWYPADVIARMAVEKRRCSSCV